MEDDFDVIEPAPPLDPEANQHAAAKATFETACARYADARRAMEDAHGLISRDTRDLEEAVKAAVVALKEAQGKHAAMPLLVSATLQQEANRDVVVATWGLLPEDTPKTVRVAGGKVQVRVGKDVEVIDKGAFARDLLQKGLFDAAVESMKVNGKLLRPLADAGALAGALPHDKVSLAWLPEAA